MISLREYEPMSLLRPIPPPNGDCNALTDFILSHAEHLRWGKDKDGSEVQIFRLTRKLGGLAAGSEVTREFLAQYHATSLLATVKPNYGSTAVEGSGGFAGVEGP